MSTSGVISKVKLNWRMPSLVPSSSHELNGAGGIGLVFEMINDFELFALKSRNGHPLVYRRIENLKNLVEKNTL